MKKISILLLAVMATLAGRANATTTFTYLFDGGYALGMSANATVVAGNNVSDFGPFRWTQATGRVELGRASAPVLGGSAGTAMISADGTRVASTIHTEDSTLVTQGLWTQGSGWQQLLPPGPPDSGAIDNNLGSVWNLSGDGKTVVGLYWRGMNGRAHASRWTQATGVVDLGALGVNRASRADAVNYDGSVIAGWNEHETGFRRATAWVNGQQSLLGGELPGEAHAVNTLGNIVVGYQLESVSNVRQAAMWKRNGGAWSATQYLGYVPGTEPSYGLNVANGVSADGSIAVGYCTFGGDPFYTTGFVWTQSGGLVDVNQFLADHGILPDPSFSIASLQAVTPDGKHLLGFGRNVIAPFTVRSFRIDLDSPTDVASNAGGMHVRMSALPNPIRSATTLQFSLPSNDLGVLSIYDSAGRLVRRLLDGTMAAGLHRVAWDGRDATGVRVVSGVYYSRLQTGTIRTSGKLVVLE